MDTTFTRPKLRWPIDMSMHTLDGQQVFVVQCPIGISSAPLCLMPGFAPIVVQFDGSRTNDEIVAQFAPQGLTQEILQQLVQHLDDHLFLANARFFSAEKMTREAFEGSPVRPAALAGGGYPVDKGSLEALVTGYLEPFEVPHEKRSLSCLITPHIDYRRGGACYGAAYPRLAECDVDLFILIGTAHQYSSLLYHLCAKDFESPLGRHQCDVDFVTKLAQRYGVERSFKDQYLHRREHSLELQLPFLGAVRPGARIVPILVGGFHDMVQAGRYPEEWEKYESFAGALAELWRERTVRGEKVAFIAGVDMAHVGRSFGDQGALSPELMRDIAARDAQYLSAIERGDKRALFDHIAEDSDARRICGFPTMYTVLDVLHRVGTHNQCEILRYDQAVDYQSDCAVTYAGVALYQERANRQIIQPF
jgi:AmmeMemoRadiSam system protein B